MRAELTHEFSWARFALALLLTAPPCLIAMLPSASGTTVHWTQAFADTDLARRIEHIVVPANEQNLDRLTAEVLRTS